MKNHILKNICLLLAFYAGVLAFNSCTAGFEDINRPGGALSQEELDRDNYRSGVFFITLQDNAFRLRGNSTR